MFASVFFIFFAVSDRYQSFNHSYFVLSTLGDDSWDLITCYCGKPFAGRPMIECDECSIWVHLSCAKIKKSNVPDIFYCYRCRDSRGSTVKRDL